MTENVENSDTKIGYAKTALYGKDDRMASAVSIRILWMRYNTMIIKRIKPTRRRTFRTMSTHVQFRSIFRMSRFTGMMKRRLSP